MQTRLTLLGGQSAIRATFRSIHGDNGSGNLFPAITSDRISCSLPVLPKETKINREMKSGRRKAFVPGFLSRGLLDFVPEGLKDRSQAIYCLVSARKREPSRRVRYDWVR
jgi:hypothetical protein